MAQIVRSVPDAFKDAPIPPKLPAAVSPVQQAAAAAEAPLTPAEELDRLFPTSFAVVVLALKGKSEVGKRKEREPLTVYLEEATIEEWASIARPLRRIAAIMDGKGEDIDVFSLLEKHREEAITAVAAAANLSPDVVKNLRAGDLLELVQAAVKVNAGLFKLHLPLLFQTMQQWGVLGDGATLSPTLPETGSPTPDA